MDTTIAERLKSILILKDMSQGELARRSGLTTAAISRYCTGSRIPTSDNLLKICDALDVSADFLLGRTIKK